MYYSQDVAKKIKIQAKEKNILIRDMLKDCGLSVNAINTISDKKGLSSFSLAKIADYLDCSDMSNKQISTNVKNLCRLKGISLNTLIEACDLSKSFIYDLEKRDKTPSIDRISKIANYFNCSVDFILGRTETTRVVNIPDKIIDIITEQYNKNPKKIIIEMNDLAIT